MARMNKDFEEALQQCTEGLVKTVPSILDILLVKMNTYFLDQQQEVIKTQATSVLKVVEFVKILRTMQDDAFFAFLTALDQLNYRHMANEIRLAANLPVQPPPHSTISMTSGPTSTIHPAPSTATGEIDIFSQKPTMALLSKGISDYFAAHWMNIGYCLDFDPDGNEVDLIEEDGNGNPKKCCRLMLKTWIQGDKGKKPKTWQTLLDILISLDHKTAHDKVKEHLQYIQSEQQKTNQESIKVTQPVEETATDSILPSMSSNIPGLMTRSPESLKRHRNNMSVPHDSEALEFQSEYNPGASSED